MAAVIPQPFATDLPQTSQLSSGVAHEVPTKGTSRGLHELSTFSVNWDAPFPDSPIPNGSWADEVELQEKRSQALHEGALHGLPPPAAAATSTLFTSKPEEAVSCPPFMSPFHVFTRVRSLPVAGESLTSLVGSAAIRPLISKSSTRHCPSFCRSPELSPLRSSFHDSFEQNPYTSTASEPPLCLHPLHGLSHYGSPSASPGYASMDDESKTAIAALSVSYSDAICSVSMERPPARLASAEVELVDIFVGLLENPEVNPYQGSVSLDKLKLLARAEAPHVYEAAVGSAESPTFWKALMCRFRDRISLAPSRTRYKKVFLTGNTAWRENDHRMKGGLALQADFIIASLRDMLRVRPDLRLQEFLEAFAGIGQKAAGLTGDPHPPLRRADLLRVLRRYHFEVDSEDRVLCSSPAF